MKTEMVPAFEELARIETALPAMDRLEDSLAPLEAEVQAINVDSAEAMAAAGALIKQVKDIREQAKATLKPYELAVARVREFLRERLNKLVNRGELIHGELTRKMVEYDAKERKAAAQEQKKLDRQNARSGAPPQTVQPNVPTMTGASRRENYSAEVPEHLTDKFLMEFAKRFVKGDDSLRRYVMVNAAALNETARAIKDPARMEKEIPYVKAAKEVTFGGRV